MINANKNIKHVYDFNDYASEIFENYLLSFTKENGLIRDIEEYDCVEENWSYVYTDRGMLLAERMRRRLFKVGEHNFPDAYEIEIESLAYQEM